MEAFYSSIPETRNPLKIVLVVSLTAFFIGLMLWKHDQKQNRYNENRKL